MRSISSAAQAKLATQYGTEPIVIVEIQWVDGGDPIAYADRKIMADDGVTPIVAGQIVDMASIDAAVRADGSSDSTQVQVTLEDSDGIIKELCDTHDLNKRSVWVYQWFDGLALSDKFLLFKGEINGPFTWNEGDRTVSFDVTTRIEDVEAGFSMEEGDFPIVPPDALGKAWPLVFGTVCDVEAVQVRAPRYGTLASGEGIHDYTLESRICQARYIQCANVPLGEGEIVTPETPIDFTSDGLTVFVTEKFQNWGPDQSCVEDRFYTICDLMHQLEQQRAYEHETMTIIDGNRLFPQNEQITISVEGGKFTGYFTGDTFHIQSREHPDYALNPPTRCAPVDDRHFEVRGVLDQSDWVQTASGSAWYDASVYNGSSGGTDIDPQEIEDFCNVQAQIKQGNASIGGPAASRKAFDDMQSSSFFWARAGSKVFLEGEAEVLYIVNLLPCTITRVAAIKQVRGLPRLVTVPSDFYTIYQTDYDGYTVTEIGMTKPLSERSEVITNPDGTNRVVSSNWSDTLYVSVTSSVGPNPVDIIEWLVGKYTPLSIDETSFDHVRTRLTNYPSNFALTERKNVLELIQDIAVQSRCVVYVRGDTVYLKYFSEEPTPVATVSASDVLANTLKVTLSNSDELATKHVVKWKRSAYEGDLTLILKHNVAKYGTHDKELDYYTQNIFDNILKSATFWMIRDANVWKLVEFATPIKHLSLEVFDCVTLDLPDVCPTPVKAVVMSAKYDLGAQEITFTCWTPMKAGDMEPYVHAWPADIPATTIFPTEDERREGLGYNFTVAPPQGHLLYVEQEDNGVPKVTVTSGDPHPSDLDDELTTCFCPTTDDAVVDEPDPVFDALKRAQRAVQDQQQSKIDAPAAAGGVNDNKEKKQKKACGEPVYGACAYEVRVWYITPDLVGGNRGRSDPCAGPCTTDGRGTACTGGFTEMCHTFGSLFSATWFQTQIQAWINANRCNYAHLETKPYGVSGVHGIPGGEGAMGECDEVPPGDMNKPNQGETHKPTVVS